MPSFPSIGLVAALGLCTGTVHAEVAPVETGRTGNETEPVRPSCVVLQDEYGEDGAVASILEVELGGTPVLLAGVDGDSGCLPVRVGAVSDEVAIVEVPGGRSRVIDLAEVEVELRGRSLALAIAEELHALHMEFPVVRQTPRPVEVVSPDTEPPPATPQIEPRPSRMKLVVGASADYAMGSEQPLFGGRVGLELDLNPWSALRAGIEGGFGSKLADPFGDLSTVALGGWLGWRVRPIQESELGVAIDPEIAAGVAWFQGTPLPGAAVNVESTAGFYLAARLALLLLWEPSAAFRLGVGPHVGVYLVAPEVLGQGASIGGLSGVVLGGRLELSFGL